MGFVRELPNIGHLVAEDQPLHQTQVSIKYKARRAAENTLRRRGQSKLIVQLLRISWGDTACRGPILSYLELRKQLFYSVLFANVLLKKFKLLHTRCITPKRVTGLRGRSLHHFTHAAEALSKKCRSGGKSLATKKSVVSDGSG